MLVTKMNNIRINVKKAKELLVCGKEMKTMKIMEAFVSLRDALEKAINYKFGPDAYTSDFSKDELIVGYNRSDIHPFPSYDTQEFEKVKYKIDAKGVVTFIGPVVKVTRQTSFVGQLSPEDWLEMRQMDRRCIFEAKKAECAKVMYDAIKAAN